MEIENSRSALLTNLEVLQALKEYKTAKKSPGLRNLATISYETLQYLENNSANNQTTDSVKEFIKATKIYNLSKHEIIWMINDPPSSTLHMQLLIDDCDEKLTEDQINEILQLSQTYLLPLETEEKATSSQ